MKYRKYPKTEDRNETKELCIWENVRYATDV